MERIASVRVPRIWRQVHLWIALGLGLLIVPISLSGALLVFGADLDRLIDPARYAVTGSTVEQAAGVYLRNAESAASGARAAILRWPADVGAPVTVLLRGGEGGKQAAPSGRLWMVYLDPPTGRVLGVADARGSFVGRVHSLHADLMSPDLSGRQIVGFAGIGLLVLALTGIWLWWPRNGNLLKAFRWRRGPKLSSNLHHMLGLWIFAPLALMALTGAYLSFPQQARSLIAAFAEITQRPARQGQGVVLMRLPAQDPQRVVELALESAPGLKLASLSMPTEQEKLWRVQLTGADDEPRSVLVDDRSLAATVAPRPPPGDAFAAWLRRVHEAQHHGPLWRAIAFVCGLSPAIFLVTGCMMWLRRRAAKAPQFGLRVTVPPASQRVAAAPQAQKTLDA
ncbi:PepSY-associated TM helix domain-containing protein [Methylocapsa polymorpha]|uniref:PepSY-associated TM helix domain-containing protein n=1 Tax=Methylocapsa polymorpha TaxID=3080828 RepID=A0ABZ0HTR6_9HYPH|nr:PepSY-associated TM helix domain-containing protein [Methylocapsa sp. RX1]